MTDRFSTKGAAIAFTALRIMLGLLFLTHGLQKLFGFPAPSERGIADLASLMGLAGLLELVGGALVAIGLLTRISSFILSGMMAVAYFMAHAPMGFYPILNHGELAVLFCFNFLFLSVNGAGPYSIDHLYNSSSVPHEKRSFSDMHGDIGRGK
jgi:putative oxidoreductase